MRLAAFLRAVNVGGTGKLPMAELKTICTDIGFSSVRTYIASGNVVFDSPHDRAQSQALLEQGLARHMQKPTAIFLRDAVALAAIIAANPFPHAAGNRLMVILLDALPESDAMLAGVQNQRDEEMAPGPGCLFVHYPSGQGTSKLRIPGAAQGTARNLNTIQAVLGLF